MINTMHTTLASTPAQLVFGQDSILNIMHEAKWKLIRDRKQKLINKNNEREIVLGKYINTRLKILC